jgi:hypothetical protein
MSVDTDTFLCEIALDHLGRWFFHRRAQSEFTLKNPMVSGDQTETIRGCLTSVSAAPVYNRKNSEPPLPPLRLHKAKRTLQKIKI